MACRPIQILMILRRYWLRRCTCKYRITAQKLHALRLHLFVKRQRYPTFERIVSSNIEFLSALRARDKGEIGIYKLGKWRTINKSKRGPYNFDSKVLRLWYNIFYEKDMVTCNLNRYTLHASLFFRHVEKLIAGFPIEIVARNSH